MSPSKATSSAKPRAGAKKSAALAAPPGPDEGIPLGKTGRRHPALGLGLWSMGRWTPEDEKRTRDTIQYGLRRSVPWFDTAEVYGDGRSERLFGDAIAREPPATVPFVTTKVSWEHLHRAQVRAAFVRSLARLGLPSVDVYLVHAPSESVPVSETMEAMEGLWKEGKAKAVGVSNFSVDEVRAAQSSLREAPLVVNQVKYSLLAPADGEAVVDYCRQEGIVVEAYTPLARGILAGRYLDGKAPPAEVRRFARDLFEVDRFPEVVARARRIRDLAEEAGVPMASIALHWLRRRGAAPVFGASRPDQIDAIFDAWRHRPSDKVLDAADAIARESS
ncbi:MAG: aldo/keto reductase [Thermoplasmata archaeon]|nr:aldo/keto reductase [Thermoplasmata archaeon]